MDDYPYVVVVGDIVLGPAAELLMRAKGPAWPLVWWMAESMVGPEYAGACVIHLHSSPEALERLVALHPDGLVLIDSTLPAEYLQVVVNSEFFRGKVMTYDEKAVYPHEIGG